MPMCLPLGVRAGVFLPVSLWLRFSIVMCIYCITACISLSTECMSIIFEKRLVKPGDSWPFTLLETVGGCEWFELCM